MPESDRSARDELETALRPRESTSTRPTAFRLTVVDGPSADAFLRIDDATPSRVYVGSSASCELRIDDREVSRRHLAVEIARDALRLIDLDSTNGTWLDGVRIFDAALGVGRTLRVGGTTLRVDAEAPTSAPAPEGDGFGRVVGASLAMRRLYPLCARLAASDVSLVIEGETGTGKEVLAESIHDESRRSRGPFVVFDCTAVPPTLVESELFGHEKGSFTGAVATRKGVFEQAHGGTLLIDEIGDLDLSLQPKLLRVLQRGEVRRVGGDKWIKVDVRVLAATRRDLEREVQDGRFRDDLFFRLAVARIELPPLRARQGDVPLLARHFWKQLGGAGEPPYDLLRRFERHRWPGNVRELANAVARHLALGDLPMEAEASTTKSGSIAARADAMEAVLAEELPYPRARDRVLAEFERRYLARMLERHGGNVTKAAQASGIGRRYFTMIAARHGKGDE